MERNPNCLRKLERMNKTLRHEVADRVPVSDFFWGSFLKRWREELGLAEDTDIYRYYDLDWIVTMPNMDPHVKQFEIVEENDEEVIVRTGFEAVIRKKFDDPMPAYLVFDTNTIDKMEAFSFDDPWDDRRYFKGGDNQIAGVGFIFQSDHSVPNTVSGERYDYAVELLREKGVYPLDLGEFDLPDIE